MPSQVERFFKSQSNMDIRIHLDREQPTYTNEDVVSSHVILSNGAQLDMTAIMIKLSGSATSRLNSGKLTQSHQVCSLLPSFHCQGADQMRCSFLKGTNKYSLQVSARVGSRLARWLSLRENMLFHFRSGWVVDFLPCISIRYTIYSLNPGIMQFPQVSECYKASPTQVSGKRPAGRRTHHLLRKLPPSSGGKSTPEEIKYFLEATVRQDGILCRTQKAVEYSAPEGRAWSVLTLMN